jgi:hypothetical protein
LKVESKEGEFTRFIIQLPAWWIGIRVEIFIAVSTRRSDRG